MAARAPRPEDLYDLRVPIQLDISPDGRQVAFAVKSVAPGKDGYRTSLWIAPAARQLTVGSKSDTTPRWSPDGRTLAFLSDRGAVLQAGGGGAKPGTAEAPKEGGTQVWLLPFADGGETTAAAPQAPFAPSSSGAVHVTTGSPSASTSKRSTTMASPSSRPHTVSRLPGG